MDARGDRPRFLHRRSELGYTDESRDALPGEPEAVPADYQRQLTAAAKRGAEQRQRDAWRDCRDAILGAVDAFGQVAEPQLRDDLRPIRRQVDRLDRRLGL